MQKKSLSKQNDDKSYHFDDFLYDLIVPEEETCEEVNPADVKSSLQRDEERLIDLTIDRQLKEALEKINKKE